MTKITSLPYIINVSTHSTYPLLKFIPFQMYFIVLGASNEETLEMNGLLNISHFCSQFVPTASLQANKSIVGNIIGLSDIIVVSDIYCKNNMGHKVWNKLMFREFRGLNNIKLGNRLLDSNKYLLPVYLLMNSRLVQLVNKKIDATEAYLSECVTEVIEHSSHTVLTIASYSDTYNELSFIMQVLIYYLSDTLECFSYAYYSYTCCGFFSGGD